MSERELFDEWAKSNIENHCDAFFNGKYYVIRENSRLTKEKKNFLILSLNMGLKAWQASANRQGYKLVPVEPDEKQWCGLARHLGRYMQMNDRYCPKTLKKYFDRFIGEPPEWLTNEVGNWDSEHAFATADLPVFIYKAMIGVVE